MKSFPRRLYWTSLWFGKPVGELLWEVQGSPLGKEKQTRLEHLVLFDIVTGDAEDRAMNILTKIKGSRFQSVNIWLRCLRSS